MTNKRNCALRLATRNLKVFPIKAGGSKPIIKFSQYSSKDPEKIKAWWTPQSKRNIGVHTGDGVFVLDVDTQANGDDSLYALQQKYDQLPDTYTVATPSGGFHCYFTTTKDIRNSASKIGPGLDIRGHNGYVVAEGSEREATDGKPGGTYTAINSGPILPAPDWLEDLALSDKPNPDPRIDDEPQQDIPPGQRNNRLFKEGCALRSKGWSTTAIAQALAIRNLDFTHPLPEEEVVLIARQCAKYEPGDAASAYDDFMDEQKGHNIGDALPTVDKMQGANFKSERIEYLWRDLFPRKSLSLIAGDAGRAKTTFMLSVAAGITTGSNPITDDEDPMPKGSVMVITAEDSIENTIVPRLMAAGADLDHVYMMEVAKDLRLAEEKPRATLLKAWKAIPNLQLVILDPVTAFMSDKHDNNAPSHVRLYVSAMTDIARKLNCAVAGITHLNKDTSKHVASRILGSTSWIAAARAVYAIGPDPDDHARSIMVCIKTNFRTPDPLSFCLEMVDVKLDDGYTETYTRVRPEIYDGNATVEEIFKNKSKRISKREQAERFLLDLMEGKGWLPVSEIRKEVHRNNVCSWQYVKQKLKDVLLIETRRIGQKGVHGGGHWEWRIPSVPMPDGIQPSDSDTDDESGEGEDSNTIH
jgi:putative DNA primase/helicase